MSILTTRALKDLSTGKVRVTRAFREEYQSTYAKHAVDLSKPFESEQALKSAIVRVSIREHITPEQGDLIARVLALKED
jgi:hypothetical protein